MSPGEEAAAVTPGSVLDALARWSSGLARLPGDVASGAGTVTARPMVSDEDVARAQLEQQNLGKRTFDLATLMMGSPGGAGGVGSGARLPEAALPMDEASRMARADQLGYTREAYRGEGAPIQGTEFVEGHPGRYDTGFLGSGAIYSVNEPRIASSYARLKGQRLMPQDEAANVMPLQVRMANPKVISSEDKVDVASMEQGDRDAWLRNVYRQGHDGVVVKYADGTEEYVAPAANYRSRFAAFDPANEGTGFLLGSGSRSAAPLAAAPALREAVTPASVLDATAAASVNPDVLIGRQRTAYPGIYKDPRTLANEAAARLAPEDPALKQLFGVTRGDLYEIGGRGTRAGNVEPSIAIPKGARGSYVSAGIGTPENAQRLIDANAELMQRHPELAQPMQSWYVMDPAYQRLAQLMDPAEAGAAYTRLNTLGSMASPGSDVLTEINRGTAANMMATRGQFPQFQRYGGMSVIGRPPEFPPELAEVGGHPYHSTSQAGPMSRYLETGRVEMQSPKVPLYIQASGVPQTGFQTRLPVPDAHFTRAVGAADVRRSASDFGVSMTMPEYAQTGPWFRENVARPLGIEAVPAQGQTWGLYGPQTGVETPIGAPKLELLAGAIARRAAKLGVPAELLRDEVLKGGAHATLAGLSAGGLGDLLLRMGQNGNRQ